MLPTKLAFVDIETTGGSPAYDRVIEVGILRVENGTVVATYDKLINPQTYIPPEISMLTGITAHHLDSAPTFRLVKDEISELLDDAVFVAHNARFDWGFLKSEFGRLGISFAPRPLCTARLSRMLFPRYRRHNLDSIIERFGFTCQPRHRALPDAKVLWDFYQVITKQFDTKKVETAVGKLLKKPSIPVRIGTDTVDRLPQGPGVYIFYGAKGAPLYVGKSVNVRERVLSHFSADHTSTREFAITQQLTSIEAIETEGELGALLTESSLIKSLAPIHNRLLRNKEKLVVAYKTSKDGYDCPMVTETDQILTKDINRVLGVFRSQTAAKKYLVTLANEHSLCQKLLGVEKGKGACFGYQLSTCQGACVGKESPAKYNMRVTIAFHKTKVRAWPFTGPIVIEEGDIGHVVHMWCYLGTLKEVDSENWNDFVPQASFDYDTYQILARYILKPQHQRRIHNLTPGSGVYTSFSFTPELL